ncbi:hypothetical protein C0995_012268 [Termitomyces sp. Mi166|nr:hypothetical protein C0995_012268 [Termitomyces sp. Mi166\
MQRTLMLGKVSLMGLMSSFVTISPSPFVDLISDARYDKGLDNYFGFFTTPTLESSLKDTSIWSDGKWVIKVASRYERDAMKSLLGVPGIVQLGGLFSVTVGEYKGLTLLFIPYTGEPVDDIDSDQNVRVVARKAVRDTLGAMHHKGWHHHDVHPGNVLKDDKQRVILIDFGQAVRA